MPLKHIDVTAGRITENQYEGEDQHELSDGVQGDFLEWNATTREFDRIAHQDDLDAHTKNELELYITGYYISSPFLSDQNKGTEVVPNNTLYGMPFLIARDMTIDRIGTRCHVLEAGKSARLGIYNLGANMYPSTLLLDAGVVSLAAAGQQDIVIAQALTKGMYFVALVSDATGTAEITTSYFTGGCPLGYSADSRNKNLGWTVAQAYGALPNPFTGGGALSALAVHEIFDIYFRISSLD